MNLAARDRRRALKLWKHIREYVLSPGPVAFIAEALRREREEASMAAAQWFLFSGKNEKAKVKRVLSKPGAKASFGDSR